MQNRKLRVLHVVLDMDLGGLQRIVSLLVRNMDHSRFELNLCCLDRGGIFFKEAANACADSFVLSRRPGPFDKKMFSRMLTILKEKKIDLIHSHNGCSFNAALSGRLTGVKGIIHTDHGRLIPDKRSAILEDRVSSYLMNRIVGVSWELTDYLASDVGINRKKLVTIINGVDHRVYRSRNGDEKAALRRSLDLDEKDMVIGTVCRLDPVKNLSFMISCMPAIIRRVPRAKLLIVGDGPSKESLVQVADSLGVSSSVLFGGLRRDTESIVPIFDVYACTSLSEGTSMTILEAMSCGLPIVASAVGGNKRLINQSNGVLYPAGHVAAFSDAVATLLLDKSLRASLGKEGRARVEREFSLVRMVEEYEKLYSAVAQLDWQ